MHADKYFLLGLHLFPPTASPPLHRCRAEVTVFLRATRPSLGHLSLARVAMGFGILQLMDFIARRAFLGAGLQPHTISLPAATSSDTGGGASGQRDIHHIHYWAPPGEPRLPPLLLIHGFGPMATWQWRQQVGPLSRHFHVVVPDLLCFGASSSSCGSALAPSESAQAAALAALLDALPALALGARVAVAGTSYGGFVAYALARAAGPGRVGPVVISNSDLLKTADDDMALLQRAGAGFARTADLLMPLDARGARRLMELSFYRRQAITLLPDFVIGQAVRQLFTDKREEKIELMKATTVGTDEFQLTPLPQDVLLIWGDHDQIFPLEKAFAVKRCLGENVKLEIVEKTGHVPQMEDPDRFNKVVLDFLLASQKPSSTQHDQWLSKRLNRFSPCSWAGGIGSISMEHVENLTLGVAEIPWSRFEIKGCCSVCKLNLLLSES